MARTPHRKREATDAMTFLEKLSGSPLTLAKLLRSIREGEAKTQTEFAETLGISKQHLSHIENGRKVVSPEWAARWALLLGYSEFQFLRLALQDQLRRAGLRYTATVDVRIVQRWRKHGFLSETDQRRLQIALQNMRMSCNSTYLLDHATDHGVKADELAELLDEMLEEPSTKVVVFSQ